MKRDMDLIREILLKETGTRFWFKEPQGRGNLASHPQPTTLAKRWNDPAAVARSLLAAAKMPRSRDCLRSSVVMPGNQDQDD